MLEIELGEGVRLSIRPSAPLARIARLSPHECLRAVELLAAAARNGQGPFDDWLIRTVEPAAPDSEVDDDALFASYFRFCTLAGVRREDRLPFLRFGEALAAKGLASTVDLIGRSVRKGWRALDTWREIDPAAPLRGLDDFLDLECLGYGEGAGGWSRGRAILDAYAAWARRMDGVALNSKMLSKELAARGIRKRLSNGVLYEIVLRDRRVGGPRAPAMAETAASKPESLRQFGLV